PGQGGCHGRTLAARAAGGRAGWDALFAPAVPGFRKVPLGNIGAVVDAITPRTVAVMLEPIQGEAGVFEAGDDYLRALRALTAERGILLIVGGVQTGVRRPGRFFASQHAAIQPAILTLATPLPP